MPMSRKDYEATASIIKATRAGVASEPVSDTDSTFIRGVLCGTKNVAVGLANTFADDNDRFDFARFYTACGIENPDNMYGVRE